MHQLRLALVLALMLATPTAIAVDHYSSANSETQALTTISTGEDLDQALYIAESFVCTVIEVSTQYASNTHKSSFQCIVESGDSVNVDGQFFQLLDLPPEFEQRYRSRFSSGRVKLEARNLYLSGFKLIFTSATTWSLTAFERSDNIRPPKIFE